MISESALCDAKVAFQVVKSQAIFPAVGMTSFACVLLKVIRLQVCAVPGNSQQVRGQTLPDV
jgi:hypothetical protein